MMKNYFTPNFKISSFKINNFKINNFKISNLKISSLKTIMLKSSSLRNRLLVMPLLAVLLGCSSDNNQLKTPEEHLTTASNPLTKQGNIVWAVNIAGEQYLGLDGIEYQADNLVLPASKGVIDVIRGSQDARLFQSYRRGGMAIKQPLENGHYNIIFKFAEPDDIAVGQRVFDVYAEGKRVIDDLDIKLARDGKHKSALARGVNNVVVTDGQLDIEFKASIGQAVLSAIIVRKQVSSPNLNDTKNWQLVWQDEFDYQGKPDPSKWSYDRWPARKVNDEDQTYTDSDKNVYVKDGRLHISAHKENIGDAKYSSGRIHSQGKGDFLYGRAEIRAKLPAGQGTWSAIWMLPSDPYKYASSCGENEDWQGSASCDAWPNSGEIDIMEHVGYDMQTVHGTVHNRAYYWANWQQRKGSIEGVNVEQAFHVYAVEWTPKQITVFFDGVPYFIYANESDGWQAWPYDHAYHVILNLAIGGMWGRAGGPIDDSIFPVTMEVDYVRIFKSLDPLNPLETVNP